MLMDDVSPDVDDSRWAVVEPNTYWGHWFTDEPTQGYLFDALDEAFKLLDTREPFDGGFYASVAPAHAALRAGIAQAGAPLGVDITAIGHAHLDVAWLWPLGQSRRKAGRTFQSVIRLMEQFPDYHFTQSQPQPVPRHHPRQQHQPGVSRIATAVCRGSANCIQRARVGSRFHYRAG